MELQREALRWSPAAPRMRRIGFRSAPESPVASARRAVSSSDWRRGQGRWAGRLARRQRSRGTELGFVSLLKSSVFRNEAPEWQAKQAVGSDDRRHLQAPVWRSLGGRGRRRGPGRPAPSRRCALSWKADLTSPDSTLHLRDPKTAAAPRATTPFASHADARRKHLRAGTACRAVMRLPRCKWAHGPVELRKVL